MHGVIIGDEQRIKLGPDEALGWRGPFDFGDDATLLSRQAARKSTRRRMEQRPVAQCVERLLAPPKFDDTAHMVGDRGENRDHAGSGSVGHLDQLCKLPPRFARIDRFSRKPNAVLNSPGGAAYIKRGAAVE